MAYILIIFEQVSHKEIDNELSLASILMPSFSNLCFQSGINNKIKTPVIIGRTYKNLSDQQLQLAASADIGSLLIDGLIRFNHNEKFLLVIFVELYCIASTAASLHNAARSAPE